jgi:hypothetical protein
MGERQRVKSVKDSGTLRLPGGSRLRGDQSGGLVSWYHESFGQGVEDSEADIPHMGEKGRTPTNKEEG